MEAQNKLITGHTKPVSVSKMVSSSSSSAVTQTKKPTIISKVADHYVKKTQIVSSGNSKVADHYVNKTNKTIVVAGGNSKVANHYVNKAIVANGNTSPQCIRAMPRAA